MLLKIETIASMTKGERCWEGCLQLFYKLCLFEAKYDAIVPHESSQKKMKLYAQYYSIKYEVLKANPTIKARVNNSGRGLMYNRSSEV